MSDSLVSIVIPTFNRASLVGFTLDSLLAQTYPHWECILVDDSSTDDTWQVMTEYARKDDRIKLFRRNREPKGAPVCRNIGLANATGEFVIYLDSDDVLASGCLAQRVACFDKNSQYSFLVFKAWLFTDKPEDAAYLWNDENEEEDLVRFLRLDALWQTTGPIYKRSYLLAQHGFREDLLFWQDFDLHLRCLFSGAPYKKFFDYPPDYYIRTGRTDTISRSTAFTARKDVLDRRILFYYELIPIVQVTSCQDKRKLIEAVDSILYFFCAQYLIRFSKLALFVNAWKVSNSLISGKSRSSMPGIVYAMLIKSSIRFPMIKGLMVYYARWFGNKVPDYFILNRNTMMKVKIN